jgi:2-succinyl-6-hydroxy-2,4-cyclohexadiene-1-carboxylate synthase
MSVTLLRTGPAGAPRVTILPGFMGGPRSVEALVHHLPDAFTVRVVTLPGHGDRPFMPTDATWPELMDAVASEVAPRGAGANELLVGYSMGGRVALDLATRLEDAFTHVIAVSADLGLADAAARASRVAEDETRATEIERDGLEAFVDRWQALPLFASQARLPARTLDAQRRMRLANTEAGLAWALRHLGTGRMPDLRAPLGASSVAVTFAAGSLDAKFTKLAEEGARLAQRGDWAAFHDVGHNVPLEAPKRLAHLVVERATRGSSSRRDEESTAALMREGRSTT